MPTEFEAKFLDIDRETLIKKLNEIGANKIHDEILMKRILFTRTDNPQLKVHFIRVRDEGDVVRLSAKVHAGKDGKLDDQKELDVIVSDFEKTVEILKLSGFIEGKYQENYREKWEFDGAEIAIDRWPSLNTYVEIEANSEQKVKDVAEKLSFDWNKKFIQSLLHVYVHQYGLEIKDVDEMTSFLTFEKDPFKNLKN